MAARRRLHAVPTNEPEPTTPAIAEDRNAQDVQACIARLQRYNIDVGAVLTQVKPMALMQAMAELLIAAGVTTAEQLEATHQRYLAHTLRDVLQQVEEQRLKAATQLVVPGRNS